MNFKKTIFATIFMITFLIALIYMFISIKVFFNESKNLYITICSIFINLIVCKIFLIEYVSRLKKDDISNRKNIVTTILNSKYTPIFLLLLTVTCLGAYNYVLIENGFASGKQLFWQIATLVLAILSCCFIVYIIKKYDYFRNITINKEKILNNVA